MSDSLDIQEAVKIAQAVVASKCIHDSAPRIDLLARAVIALESSSKHIVEYYRGEVAELLRQLAMPRMVRPDPAPEYTGPCVCSPESDCVYHDVIRRDTERPR